MSHQRPKLLVVQGSRPEHIKCAPVIKGLRASPRYEVVVCNTGQHREMADGISSLFGITVDYELSTMMPNQDLNQLAHRLLDGVARIIRESAPELVIVQGDTTTALVAALAAFHAKRAILHVEAGYRSGRKDQPFPEEINRAIIGRLADIHCAPTERAADNLRKEGITTNIWVTGSTGIDAMHLVLPRLDGCPPPLGFAHCMGGRDKRRILVTCHRRETIGAPLTGILRGLKRIAHAFPCTDILFPVHMNPQIRGDVFQALADIKNIALVEPLPYPDLLRELRDCYMVVSDSGGLQEEAPSLGKPVLVLRNVTERIEGIEAGNAQLVGTDENSIVSAITKLLTDADTYARMATAKNPYGDGKATSRIIAAIDSSFAVGAP
jgi:UDP-N-acetylglucosamine 2-epimerase (non-hydrolysing)